jgi:hypothetical protein
MPGEKTKYMLTVRHLCCLQIARKVANRSNSVAIKSFYVRYFTDVKCVYSRLDELHGYTGRDNAILCVSATVYRSSMAPRSVRSTCDRGSLATLLKVSHRMGDQNLLSQAPPCFGRHVKLLVRLHLQSLASTPVLSRVDVRQAAGRKNNCQIFITT